MAGDIWKKKTEGKFSLLRQPVVCVCVCVVVCVMDRYHALLGSRTIPGRRSQSREQALVYWQSLAQEKPLFLKSVAELMKVTQAAANINKGLAGF